MLWVVEQLLECIATHPHVTICLYFNLFSRILIAHHILTVNHYYTTFIHTIYTVTSHNYWNWTKIKVSFWHGSHYHQFYVNIAKRYTFKLAICVNDTNCFGFIFFPGKLTDCLICIFNLFNLHTNRAIAVRNFIPY